MRASGRARQRGLQRELEQVRVLGLELGQAQLPLEVQQVRALELGQEWGLRLVCPRQGSQKACSSER